MEGANRGRRPTVRAAQALRWLVFVASLGALLLTVVPTQVAAGQLIARWDFESDADFAGWQVSGGELSRSPGRGLAGSDAAAAVSQAPTAMRAFHAAPVAPGGAYRLSGHFQFDADDGVSFVQLNLAWTNAHGQSLSQTAGLLRDPQPAYQELAREFSIPCDALTGGVEVVILAGAGSTVYFDAVSLEQTGSLPCPTPTRPPSPLPSPPPPPPGVTPPGVTPPPGLAPTPTPEAGPRPGGAAPTPTPPLLVHGLLVNGGFEVAQGGQPVGWRKQGGVLTQASSPVHGGRFSGALTSASSSTKWAYQIVPVVGGAWYEFDAYVYQNDPRVQAALLRISWYASADGSGGALATVDSAAELAQPAPDFRYLTTGPVQAPPGVQSARARILLRPRSEASAVIYIDDASFRPTTPRPVEAAGGSSASAGAGSGGNISASRRSTGSTSRGGGGTTSQVLGVSTGGGALPSTPGPTPLIQRSARLPAQERSSGGGLERWAWALVGGGIVVVGGGASAWAVRRRHSGGKRWTER